MSELKRLNGDTIPEIFQNQVAKYGDRACVAYKPAGAKSYVDISWNTMNDMVQQLGWYFLSLGVKKGDRIAIFSENRYEWWVADLAILSVGGVNVPIYATNSAEEAYYILDHAGCAICCCGTQDHVAKVYEVKKRLKGLKRIISFNDMTVDKKDFATLKEAMEKGKGFKNKGEFAKRIKAVKPEQMATIIYTSGTTGNPKGVMLSENNFVSNARQIFTKFSDYINENNTLLSFLPLSHSLERTAGYYMPLCAGAKVAFAKDFATIVEDMQEVQPTFIISVPRLYEKIHGTILSRLPDASAIKRLLFAAAMAVAKKNLPYACNDKPRTGLFKLVYGLFDKLVYSKFKSALGMGNMNFAVSGGAPLSIGDAEFFIGMGLKILEGFGLTETTPVTNVNPIWHIKPGTVGPALPGTTVKISDEGELLIKGPQVMMGYYKNKKATDECMTRDGFFRTGDIAMIDEDGFVSITGRIKDIIVTAGGKNISPQNIENSLKDSKYIEQVAIIGDKRKYLSALVIPNFQSLQGWAKTKGIEFADSHELVSNPEVHALFEQELQAHTKHFSRVEQIRKFTLLDAEWTQATGELTPSLKVKRRVLEQKYKDMIEAMYPVDLS